MIKIRYNYRSLYIFSVNHELLYFTSVSHFFIKLDDSFSFLVIPTFSKIGKSIITSFHFIDFFRNKHVATLLISYFFLD